MSEIRIPTQKRSIEKRNKIIEKGFELMCNNGYYNTNTNEIMLVFLLVSFINILMIKRIFLWLVLKTMLIKLCILC